jgi:hypothetical protein
MPAPETGVVALGLLEAAVVLMLLFGAAGRVTAIVGLLVLGINQIFASLTLGQFLLVTAYTAILFLGTGAYSLWTPEDRLIYRRAGEAPSV